MAWPRVRSGPGGRRWTTLLKSIWLLRRIWASAGHSQMMWADQAVLILSVHEIRLGLTLIERLLQPSSYLIRKMRMNRLIKNINVLLLY